MKLPSACYKRLVVFAPTPGSLREEILHTYIWKSRLCVCVCVCVCLFVWFVVVPEWGPGGASTLVTVCSRESLGLAITSSLCSWQHSLPESPVLSVHWHRVITTALPTGAVELLQSSSWSHSRVKQVVSAHSARGALASDRHLVLSNWAPGAGCLVDSYTSGVTRAASLSESRASLWRSDRNQIKSWLQSSVDQSDPTHYKSRVLIPSLHRFKRVKRYQSAVAREISRGVCRRHRVNQYRLVTRI